MTTFRDRWIEGWDRVLPASAVLGTLLMIPAWGRQRSRLARQLRLAEEGWEEPDA